MSFVVCDYLCLCNVQVTKDKVRSHLEQQDYISALRELVLPSIKEKLPGSSSVERDLGSEALRVAALHDHFGHKLVNLYQRCSMCSDLVHCVCVSVCLCVWHVQGGGYQSSA